MKALFRYLRGARQELKKVTWPSRHEALKLTGAVIVFSIVFALFMSVVDFGLDQVFERLILRGSI